MAEEHDKTHRLIFAFPRMIEDLIRLCMGGAWVDRLDFSTLEKVPERLLSPELLRREQDVLWRLAYRCPEEGLEWFYIYLHVEHQSNPRRKMALYTTSYKMLAWEDLVRRGELTPDEKLPPVLSVVFYTGEGPWNVKTSLLDEIQTLPDAPEGMDLWSYRLIDVSRYPLDEMLGAESPLVGLFQLAQAEDALEIPAMAKEISGVLGPEDEELRRAFVTLINEEVLPRLAGEDGKLQRITGLEESPMLEATMDRIVRRLKTEGEARLFLELFTTRFGDVPNWVRERVAAAQEKQLETWAKRLLTAESPEAVFA